MQQPIKQKMRLLLTGAISVFENDCLEIPSLLQELSRPDLAEAFDAVGTALYWMKDEIDGEKE